MGAKYTHTPTLPSSFFFCFLMPIDETQRNMLMFVDVVFPGRRLLYFYSVYYTVLLFQYHFYMFYSHKRERESKKEGFLFCVGAARVFTKAKNRIQQQQYRGGNNDVVSLWLLLSVLLSELQCVVVCKARAIDETKWYYFIHQLCERDVWMFM